MKKLRTLVVMLLVFGLSIAMLQPTFGG